jgi:twinkle protein
VNLITPDTIDFSAYMRETETSTKVRPAAAYMQELIDALGTTDTSPRAYLPWDKTHDKFAFRPGEVTLWAGVNGHGKSLITGMVALSLMAQNERVCVASFEMKPRKSLERMTRQWTAELPSGDFGMDERVIAAFKDLYEQFQGFTDKRLWFYDQQGTVDVGTLIGVIRYCAKELGIQHFFIDSLMKCVSGEDDYNGQKNFVDELTAIARDYGMHIHLVHHIKKLSSEEAQPDKMDVKGTGAITDQVDNLLLVWRNKKKEKDQQAGKKSANDEPDALLICEKQRNGEWEGRVGLWFERHSQQYVPNFGAPALTFYDFPHRSVS